MNQVISDKKNELEQLCHTYHVEKLEVFGSVTNDSFHPKTSDIDFLVEFNSTGLKNYADNYFGLYDELKNLFKTPIDLIVSSSIKNPYFLKSIEADRHFLYAA